MCGRFTLTQSAEIVAQVFNLKSVLNLKPRYNIAPTQSIPAILQLAEGAERELQMLYWGLIPSWAKDKKIGVKAINARAETVTVKPTFRSAFQKRRCLIVADGFYEWQGEGKQKQPYYCHLRDGGVLALAGLWESWRSETGEEIRSCTIITTEPNEVMRPIHHRMPVILHPQDYDLWLDPQVQKSNLLQPLLQPYSGEEMEAYPVGTQVNKATFDREECRQKVAIAHSL